MKLLIKSHFLTSYPTYSLGIQRDVRWVFCPVWKNFHEFVRSQRYYFYSICSSNKHQEKIIGKSIKGNDAQTRRWTFFFTSYSGLKIRLPLIKKDNRFFSTTTFVMKNVITSILLTTVIPRTIWTRELCLLTGTVGRVGADFLFLERGEDFSTTNFKKQICEVKR